MAVDFYGARGLLKPCDGQNGCPGCYKCNVHLMYLEGRMCSDCPFSFNSRAENKRTRVYPGKKFKRYGWNFGQKYGKHTFFYFMYHPWMNCKFPEYPDEDLLGNRIATLDERGRKISGDGTKRFLWHIHHLNGNYWDDSPWNLLLCLNTEHGFFEADVKRFNRLSERIIWG
jgi:hypothetical protein